MSLTASAKSLTAAACSLQNSHAMSSHAANDEPTQGRQQGLQEE